MSKLHSLKDISERYGISVPMLKKLIFNGEIERVKVGAKNYMTEEVIEVYITKNTIPSKVEV